jgi:hypothetical protein
MSTGCITQVAPIPDKPPFAKGLIAAHTGLMALFSDDILQKI